MKRDTGTYRVTKWENEEVRAFVPAPLPPANPPLALDDAPSTPSYDLDGNIPQLGDWTYTWNGVFAGELPELRA